MGRASPEVYPKFTAAAPVPAIVLPTGNIREFVNRL